MALRTENVQAAHGCYFIVLFVGLLFVEVVGCSPFFRRNRIFVSVVVKNGRFAIFLWSFNLSLRHAELLRDSLLDHLLLGHEFRIAAKQDIGTSSGHIGRYCDHAFATGLGDDLGFAFVELGVQHHMLNALFLQEIRKPLGLLDGGSAHQYRLPLHGELLNLVSRREVLFLLGTEYDVRILNAQHLLVRRNHHDIEFVNLVEFGGFRFGGTGHPGQLFEHAEVVLKRDRRQSLILALDLYAFFRSNRLVQPVGPTPAGHHASGKLVDDDDFTVFYDIFHVAAIERMGFDACLHVVFERPVFGVRDIANAKQTLDLLPALVGHGDVSALLVDYEITRELRLFTGRSLNLFTFFELRD